MLRQYVGGLVQNRRKLVSVIYILLGVICIFAYTNCSSSGKDDGGGSPIVPADTGCLDQLGSNTEWGNETEVVISNGYTGNAMEPQISADGVVLLFNNKTSDDTQMNIHFAVKQSDGSYAWAGELSGANQAGVLDGVPATDSLNNFYFMSLRNYGASGRWRSLFGAQFSSSGGLSLANIAAADASFSDGTAPSGGTLYVDMDLGLSWDGTEAIVARAKFSGGKGYPDTSVLELFSVNSTTRALTANTNSAALLQNVNVDGCKLYAPSMSQDKKELYYTVLTVRGTNTYNFKVVVSKRANTSDSFGVGSVITGVTGELTEGPSISYVDGGKTLYYHKKDPVSGLFKIYKLTRP